MFGPEQSDESDHPDPPGPNSDESDESDQNGPKSDKSDQSDDFAVLTAVSPEGAVSPEREREKSAARRPLQDAVRSERHAACVYLSKLSMHGRTVSAGGTGTSVGSDHMSCQRSVVDRRGSELKKE